MTRRVYLCILTAALLHCAVDRATAETNSVQLRLGLNLTDGSRVVGTPVANTLALKTEYGTMELDLKLVDSVTFALEKSEAAVTFANGDKLKGQLGVVALELNTIFGRHAVPIKHVASLDVMMHGAALTPLPSSLRKDLLLHCSFNAKDRDRANDTSGKRHHGKIVAAKWVNAGKRGGACSFDGKNSQIDLPHVLRGRKRNVTFAAWCRVRGTGGKANMRIGLVTHRADSRDVYLGYQDGQCQWGIYDTGSAHHQISTPLGPDKWAHLVGTYDGQTQKLYLNGNLASNRSGNFEMDFDASYIGTMVGRFHWQFDGLIDDVMIWSRALSAKEVQQLHRLQGGK